MWGGYRGTQPWTLDNRLSSWGKVSEVNQKDGHRWKMERADNMDRGEVLNGRGKARWVSGGGAAVSV